MSESLPLLTQRYAPNATLALPDLALSYEQRQRPRLHVMLDDGRAVSWLLNPPVKLKDQDLLGDAEAPRLRIRARAEPTLVACTDDPLLLARAAYHLGNRHVAVALVPGGLVLQPDHVLHELLQQLGLNVQTADRPFNPEGGAYAAHQHGPRRFVHAS